MKNTNKDKGSANMKNTNKDKGSATLCVPSENSNQVSARALLPDAGKSKTLKAPLRFSAEIESEGRTLIQRLTKWRTDAESIANALCAWLDKCHNAGIDGMAWLLKEYPSITPRSLRRLEAIGRGRLLPEIGLDMSYASTVIEKWPVEKQKQLISGGGIVEVAKKDHVTGRVIAERKHFRELSHSEVARAIRVTGPVPVKEQCVAKTIDIKPSYEFDAKACVVVFHRTEWTLTALELLVSRLKSQAMEGLQESMREHVGGAGKLAAARDR